MDAFYSKVQQLKITKFEYLTCQLNGLLLLKEGISFPPFPAELKTEAMILNNWTWSKNQNVRNTFAHNVSPYDSFIYFILGRTLPRENGRAYA